MMHNVASTKNMETLWERARRDALKLRVYLHADSTDDETIFVVALHTKTQSSSLIEVKTKNLESAAAKILDEYHRINH